METVANLRREHGRGVFNMNNEQAVLDAFERGKAFGFAEGMKSMRPINSVLVPSDKLAEMQDEIKKLTQENHDLWEQLND